MLCGGHYLRCSGWPTRTILWRVCTVRRGRGRNRLYTYPVFQNRLVFFLSHAHHHRPRKWSWTTADDPQLVHAEGDLILWFLTFLNAFSQIQEIWYMEIWTIYFGCFSLTRTHKIWNVSGSSSGFLSRFQAIPSHIPLLSVSVLLIPVPSI